MSDDFLPMYELYEPCLDRDRYIGEATGFENAEGAVRQLLEEGECVEAMIRLNGRLVAIGTLVVSGDPGDPDVEFTTIGRRRDLR